MMKKYIKLVVFFMCIIYGISGCRPSDVDEISESISVDMQHQIKKMPYAGYFQKEIELSPYEPLHGAYLGAYVLANPQIEFDITQFEDAVGKEMAVAVRHYQLGDPFPDKWLLECLAQKKAPHIVITPQSLTRPYEKAALEETALKFKDTYGIPVFIEFYPSPKEFGDPGQYISYFQLAREIFAHHAPNAVFVWGIDMEDVYDSMVYYPGDDYVDWVGLRMYFPIYKDHEPYEVDIDKYLTYFYNMYQDKKPMMISKLAISHYSKKGHAFYVEEAITIMNHLYTQLPVHYPRIKAINYIDIDNTKVAPGDTGSDNFSVSTEPKITRAYKDAIGDSYYLQNVEQSGTSNAYEWMKMRTPIYEWQNKLYVAEETLLYDWGMTGIGHLAKAKVIIGGSEYYSLDLLVKKMNYRYTLNQDILRVYQSSKDL